jgi:hypothetical protein
VLQSVLIVYQRVTPKTVDKSGVPKVGYSIASKSLRSRFASLAQKILARCAETACSLRNRFARFAFTFKRSSSTTSFFLWFCFLFPFLCFALLYFALSSIRRQNDFVIMSKRANWGQYYPSFARFELFGAPFAVRSNYSLIRHWLE